MDALNCGDAAFDPPNDPPAVTAHLPAWPEDYLEHDGQMIHKQTFCHLYLS